MSIQAMAWALEQQIVKDSAARFILLVYANYAGADGTTAHPSNKTIQRLTGLPERTIWRKIKLLRKAGLLLPGDQARAERNSDRRDRTPRCYDIPIYTRGATVAPRKGHGVPKTGVRGATQGTHGVPSCGTRSVNRTVNEPAREKDRPVDKSKFLTGLKQVKELLP